MAGFADGQIRDRQATQDRCLNSINDRFAQGQPHGIMTVTHREDKQPFMHLVAGLGDRPGMLEIAYAMMSSHQGKGLGKDMITQLITTWVPEVRRLGLGKGLDPLADQSVLKPFNVFKALNYAMASPSNFRSWFILEDPNFEAATCNVTHNEIVQDFNQKDFDRKHTEQYHQLDQSLVALFDTQKTAHPLQPGTRYRITDMSGNMRTFSKHIRWDHMNFHFHSDKRIYVRMCTTLIFL